MTGQQVSRIEIIQILGDYVFEDADTHEKFFFVTQFSQWIDDFLKKDVLPYQNNVALQKQMVSLATNSHLSESQQDILVGNIALSAIVPFINGYVVVSTDFRSKIFNKDFESIIIYSKSESAPYIKERDEKFKKIVLINDN